MNLTVINFLSKLKNVSLIKKKIFVVKFNISFLPILNILYKEGLLLSYIKKNNNIVIYFNYFHNTDSLKNLKIISSMAKSIYLNKINLSKIVEKNKLLVFSTSKGILTSLECKKMGIGGKFIFIC